MMKHELRKTCSLLPGTSSWNSKPRKGAAKIIEQAIHGSTAVMHESTWTTQVSSLSSPRLFVVCFSMFTAVLLRWLALLFLAEYDSTASGESSAEARLASWIVTCFSTLPFSLGCRNYATERDAEPEERWNPMSRRGLFYFALVARTSTATGPNASLISVELAYPSHLTNCLSHPLESATLA